MSQRQFGSQFLTGRSQAAQVLQLRDWQQTSLGNLKNWPHSLKTTLNLVLNTPCPMFCVWGADRILFYNDASADCFHQLDPSITNGDAISDRPVSIWHRILTLVEQVSATGQPQQQDSLAAPSDPAPAKKYTWSYCPLWDEAGQVVGVFASGNRVTVSQAPGQPSDDLPFPASEMHRLANSLPVLLAYVDRDRRYRFVNRTYTDWFRLPPAEIMGQHVWDVIGTAAYQAIAQDIDAVLQGQSFSSEIEVCFKHLGHRRVQRFFVPDVDGNGDIKGYYALVNDVTEHRRTEQALQQREEELRLVTDSVPVLIAFVDNEQRYRFTNRTYEDWFGVSPEALRHQHIRDVLGEAGYQIIRPYIEQALRGETVTFEQEIAFKLDGTRHIEATYVPRFDSEGTVDGFVALVRDITERKRAEAERCRAEAALQESEARFRRIADCSPIMFWMSAPDGAGIWFNQQWYKYTGQTPAAALGSGWLAALHPEDARLMRETCAQARRDHQPVRLEYRLRQRTGEYRWVLDSAMPRFDEQGEHLGYIGSIVDIHDRKQAEAEREQLLLELALERARLEAVLRQMPEGVLIADAASERLILANEQTRRILRHDYDPGSVLRSYRSSEPFTAYRPNGNPYTADEYPLARSLRHGEIITQEVMELQFPDESEKVIIEVNAAPIRDRQGKIISAITVFQDITERQRSAVALREAEERLRIALQSAPITVFNQDRDLRYTWIYQPAFHQSEEVLGRRDHDILSPADAAALTVIKQRVLETGLGIQAGVKITQDGTDFYFDLTLEPLLDPMGAIVGVTGSTVDISPLKRTAIQLQESEERLRLALEEAQMATWDVDLTTGVAIWSDRHFEMLGYEPTENGIASEAMWANCLHPDDRQRVWQEWQQARLEKRYYRTEYRVIRADNGQISWLEGLGNFKFDAQGQAVRSIGVLLDISDRKRDEAKRKQAETAAQEQRTILETILRQAADAILVCDANGQLTFVNREARRLAQLDPESTNLNIDFRDWGTAYDPEGNRIPLEEYSMVKALQGISSNAVESRMVRQDGSYYDILMSAAPLWNEQQQIIGAVGTFMDISDRKRAEEALRESEARFRHLADTAPMLVWMSDTSKLCTYFNQTWLNFTGRTPAQELGNGWAEGVHPDDFERCLAIYTNAFDARRDFEMEYRLRRHDGKYRWIFDVGVPRFTADGEFLGYIGSCFDIDDRKQAEAERDQVEAALRQSEERLRMAQKAAGAGLWNWDIANNQVTWSEEYYALYGLETTVIPSYENWIACIVEVDQDRVQQAVHKALEHATNLNVEFRTQHSQKGLRWIVAIGQTFADAKGQPMRMTGIALDITEQKRFEHALIKSEALAKARAEELTAIMETTPAAIWIAHDPQCHHITANQTAYQLMRLPPGTPSTATAADGINALPFRQCRQGHDIPPPELPMQKAARTGQEVTDDLELVFDDGTVSYLYGKAKPLFSPSGKVRGAIGGFVEITALKHSEHERERLLQRERQAREAAENASRIKDEFLAILSHELRSPLNPILGWITLLRRGKLDADRTAQGLATIERNAKLQIQLIDDLLDISRIIRGKLSLKIAPTNLETIIRAAMETVQLAAEAKGLPIHTELAPSVGPVMGDAARLQQVVWNLLSNAVKFTPAGGQITVKLSALDHRGQPVDPATSDAELPPQYAQIQVIDTGKGIPAAFLPHVFEYFRQADSTTTRSFGGLGLGLAIVRYLVELHGGTVGADSPGEGQGATFTVRLPLSPTSSLNASPTVPLMAQLPGASQVLEGVRVLVIDDDTDTREFIAFALAEHGAVVTAIASARQALHTLAMADFDIIISDVGMPEMDGFLMMQTVRERDHTTPAIALTAYARDSDRDRAMASGFQRHLPKPVELDVLIATIRQLV